MSCVDANDCKRGQVCFEKQCLSRGQAKAMNIQDTIMRRAPVKKSVEKLVKIKNKQAENLQKQVDTELKTKQPSSTPKTQLKESMVNLKTEMKLLQEQQKQQEVVVASVVKEVKKEIISKESKQTKSSVIVPSWKLRQGEKGFNSYARTMIKASGWRLDPPKCGQKGLKQQQRLVQFLMHPDTTVNRLLLAHQLGTGKTIAMIAMLENFYDDPRPMVVLVPKVDLVAEFYADLLRVSNRFKDYLESRLGPVPQGEEQLKSYKAKCKDILEKKGQIRNGEVLPDKTKTSVIAPSSPLRCFTFTNAGGTTFANQPLLKVAHAVGKNSTGLPRKINMFDNCIIMVDEAHILARPDLESSFEPDQVKRVKGLAENLYLAGVGTRLAMLTATPIVDSAEDGEKLMRIVYGTQRDANWTSEGYISWFMNRLPGVFATTTPAANVLPTIVRVPLTGQNLEIYKKAAMANGGKPTDKLQKLENSVSGSVNHEKQLSKFKLLLGKGQEASLVSSKLARIVEDVKLSKLKTAILMDRTNGLQLLDMMFAAEGVTSQVMLGAPSGSEGFKLRTHNDMLKGKFNHPSNIRGEKIQVLILDTKTYSEGINLMNVRHIILADFGPKLPTGRNRPTWGKLKQRMGRALRFCSHADLPAKEQTLQLSMYVTVVDEVARSSIGSGFMTIEEQKLAMIVKQLPLVEDAMCALEKISIDAKLYGSSMCVQGCSNPFTKQDYYNAWKGGYIMAGRMATAYARNDKVAMLDNSCKNKLAGSIAYIDEDNNNQICCGMVSKDSSEAGRRQQLNAEWEIPIWSQELAEWLPQGVAAGKSKAKQLGTRALNAGTSKAKQLGTKALNAGTSKAKQLGTKALNAGTSKAKQLGTKALDAGKSKAKQLGTKALDAGKSKAKQLGTKALQTGKDKYKSFKDSNQSQWDE